MDDDKIGKATALGVGNVLAASDLLRSAGATMKGKRRPIKVTGRGGEVVGVRPHVEVIEGLLFQAGITEALQDGLRPKSVLCAVCRCVVEVKPGNVPVVCKQHKGKRLCPGGCGSVVGTRTSACEKCKVRETILCKFCALPVHLKGVGPIPTTCWKHRQSKPCPAGCGRPVVARAKACWECDMGRRKASAAAATAVITAAARREVGFKSWETRRAKQAAKG